MSVGNQLGVLYQINEMRLILSGEVAVNGKFPINLIRESVDKMSGEILDQLYQDWMDGKVEAPSRLLHHLGVIESQTLILLDKVYRVFAERSKLLAPNAQLTTTIILIAYDKLIERYAIIFHSLKNSMPFTELEELFNEVLILPEQNFNKLNIYRALALCYLNAGLQPGVNKSHCLQRAINCYHLVASNLYVDSDTEKQYNREICLTLSKHYFNEILQLYKRVPNLPVLFVTDVICAEFIKTDKFEDAYQILLHFYNNNSRRIASQNQYRENYENKVAKGIAFIDSANQYRDEVKNKLTQIIDHYLPTNDMKSLYLMLAACAAMGFPEFSYGYVMQDGSQAPGYMIQKYFQHLKSGENSCELFDTFASCMNFGESSFFAELNKKMSEKIEAVKLVRHELIMKMNALYTEVEDEELVDSDEESSKAEARADGTFTRRRTHDNSSPKKRKEKVERKEDAEMQELAHTFSSLNTDTNNNNTQPQRRLVKPKRQTVSLAPISPGDADANGG